MGRGDLAPLRLEAEQRAGQRTLLDLLGLPPDDDFALGHEREGNAAILLDPREGERPIAATDCSAHRRALHDATRVRCVRRGGASGQQRCEPAKREHPFEEACSHGADATARHVPLLECVRRARNYRRILGDSGTVGWCVVGGAQRSQPSP